jgi:hypothetical protein
MLQDHRIAITAQVAGEDYGPIVGSTHRASSPGHYIYAIMHYTVSDAEG